MRLRHVMAGAIVAATPLTAAMAAGEGYDSGAPTPEQVQTLHVGPGNAYEILTTIRAGTSPRLEFCQYHGRWCYGSYGRWNGWFYGGENTWDIWSFGYWLSK